MASTAYDNYRTGYVVRGAGRQVHDLRLGDAWGAESARIKASEAQREMGPGLCAPNGGQTPQKSKMEWCKVRL